MPNLRIRSETESDKLSLLMPGVHSPGPRSLVLQVHRLSRMVPNAQSTMDGVLPKTGNEPGETPPPWTETREKSFDYWRVDTVGLVNTRATWLDDPSIRLLPGRRSLVIVNQDLANPIWVSHGSSPAAAGGYIAAGGSITLPFSNRAKIFAVSVAATGNISFYQFA